MSRYDGDQETAWRGRVEKAVLGLGRSARIKYWAWQTDFSRVLHVSGLKEIPVADLQAAANRMEGPRGIGVTIYSD